MEPKVSVIVNFFNGEKYLNRCITSILNQNYKNFELICWDNSSTDNSKKIIESYKDKRIRYFCNDTKISLYKARNQAIKVSFGSLIAFLDCDDWWEKNFLSSRANIFLDKNYDFFYSNGNLFLDKKSKKLKYKKYFLPSGLIFKNLCKDYFIIISGTIFRKKIFDEFGFFNENYNIIGDYDFVMKISKQLKGHATNKELFNYRVHENNFSKLNTEMFYNEYLKWFKNEEKSEDKYFLENKFFFEKKLSYLKITYFLLEKRKNLKTIIEILKHPDKYDIIKFLILFILPKYFYSFLKK